MQVNDVRKADNEIPPAFHPMDCREEYLTAGYWGTQSFASYLDHWSDADPGHPYVSDGTRSYSYAELRDSSMRLVCSLRRLGINHGDRVAVQLPNWCEYILVYAACARLGAVTIPIVPVYRGKEVRFIVENAGARVLITPGEFRGFDHAAMAAEIAAAAPTLTTTIVVRGAAVDGAHSLDELLSTDVHTAEEFAPVSADDRHLILYSSGTESKPKGCLHTWNTSSFLPKQAVTALGLSRSDGMFMPAPVTHALGMTLGVMAPTIAGAAIHLLDVFTADAAMQRIRDYRCTGTASPASFIKMILDRYDPALHDLSRLRFWLSAGAPIPGVLVDDAARLIPSCRLISAYGSSEVMMATVCQPGDPVERVVSSDGTPVPGVQIQITDADGRPVPTGVDGEICYRGPGRLLEYWGRPDLTAAATHDEGWWRTGDVGHLDDHGYLRVTGRLKDIIIRGGFNISALEVEEALLRHPLIANVAVVGIADPTVGERACAVLVLKDSRGPIPDLKGLRDFLHTTCQIAIWKVPERIEVVDELPVTTTGKIQKSELRKRFSPVDPEAN